jgi:type VI secretion system secreted protein VgrG
MASRVHQDRSVVEVLRDLLGAYDHRWELRLRAHYPRLDYLVQFEESDGDFLRRQCARWGLHVHFEHDAEGHCLVLGDGVHALHQPPLASNATLELRSHARPDEAGVLHALCTQAAQGVASWTSGAQPECHPGWQQEWREQTGPGAERGEGMVRWRGADGVSLARRDIEAPAGQRGDARVESWLNRRHADQARRGLNRSLGSGTLPGLAAGYRLRLLPGGGQPEQQHYVQRTELRWQAHGPAGAAGSPAVQLEFESRPVDDEPCPPPPVARSRPLGLQTGTVLPAPRDACSFTDAIGRLRVRLHWAHADPEASTCWIRMIRPAAGQAMGCANWPRPGQEVLVDFLDGDVDSPVCVGLLRNPAHAPPWPLPASARVSGWYSQELRDEVGDAPAQAGNHLLFDDQQGALQAQLASASEASALRLGRHAPVSRREGRGQTRGEGFELRTDAGVCVRAARALQMLSAAASRAARATVQPLQACRRQLGGMLERHAAWRPVRDARVSLPEGPVAELRADLRTGASPLLLHAQAGLYAASPQAAQVHAGAQLGCGAERDLRGTCGDSMLLHADGAAVLAAARQGLQLSASEGAVALLAPGGQLHVHARGHLRMGCVRQGLSLQGTGRLILEAAGQSLTLGPEGLRQVASGSWRVRAARRLWGDPCHAGRSR